MPSANLIFGSGGSSGGSGFRIKKISNYNLGSGTSLTLPEPIDSSKSFCKYKFDRANGSVYFSLTDTTLTRHAQNGGTNINVQVVELEGMKSFQKGVQTTYGSDDNTSGTWTVTLSTPVDPNNCIVFCSYSLNYVGLRVTVTDLTSTQLKIAWETSETGDRVNWVATAMWAVVELE